MDINKGKYIYLVAGSKPWNRRVFNEIISKLPGKWYFIKSQDELNLQYVKAVNPRYLFFLHWSWKVPDEIVDNYECVCFHMSDVPYGRGGSPLQNLIIRGHRHTKLSVLRMTQELDAGPVYLKEDLCLEGNAEEIYIRATYLAAKLIERIINENPVPVPQIGEPTIFSRRKPCESEIPDVETLQALYDFIRMLDAEGYPHAFIKYKGFLYAFTKATLYDGRVVADVTITPLRKDVTS